MRYLAGGRELYGGVRSMQVMSIVNIVELYWRRREHLKISGMRSAQCLCGVKRIDEDGCPTDDAIPQTVQDLIARWVLKVPRARSASGSPHSSATHSRSMCSPRSRFVYAMFRLSRRLTTSHSVP